MTEYVREEFNRAEQLQNGGRRGTVGFALTILQRRLASSPEAIYQSLMKLNTDEVEARIVHSGVGAITESDVLLAHGCSAARCHR